MVNIEIPDRLIPDRLRVDGTLPLDDNDRATVKGYIQELCTANPKLHIVAAADMALAQIAQDILGPTGYNVLEIEPL